jgi:hypothetical protein
MPRDRIDALHGRPAAVTGASSTIEAALGRPVAPTGRLGRWLERSSFMDAAVCVEKALAGSGQAGRPSWSTRWTGPWCACPGGSSAGSMAGRWVSSPGPEPSGAVEAEPGPGVALDSEMRP